MDKFRRDIAAEMKREEDEMPNYRDWQDADRAALAKDVADEVLQRTVKVIGAGGKSKEITMKQAIARIANGVIVTREQGNEALDDLTMIQTTLDELND
jgi:shikimate 5-dehydrogenase